jgi:hypothetical protein
MAARETWSEKEFTEASLQQLSHSGKVVINSLGLTTWTVRSGLTYDVKETKKMDIPLHDTEGKKHKLQIEGDKSSWDVKRPSDNDGNLSRGS